MNRTVRSVIFGLLTTVGAFGAIEGVAHLVSGEPPPSKGYSRIGQCRIDSAGLVCPFDRRLSVPVPAPDGRPRVVVLGGSTVRMGVPTPRDGNFPSWVAELAPDLQVVNLGIPGYSTAGVWRLITEIGPFKPDAIVVMTGHNDYNESVFDGSIRAVTLWTLPLEQVLSHSWIHQWLSPLSRLRSQSPDPGVLAISDDFAIRNVDKVDARFRTELTEVAESTAVPMVLTTLFRSFDHPPTGVYVHSAPQCAANLPPRGALPPHFNTFALAGVASRLCPGTSIEAFYRAHSTTDPAARAALWAGALRLDAAPVRAPLSADAIIRDVGQSHHLVVVDLAALDGGYQRGAWFVDPVHTSPTGAQQIAMAVVPGIREALARGSGARDQR